LCDQSLVDKFQEFLDELVSKPQLQCTSVDEFFRRPTDPGNEPVWTACSVSSPTFGATMLGTENSLEKKQITEESKSESSHFYEAKIISSDSNDGFTAYNIIICEYFAPKEYITWSIKRRYREFESLYNTLTSKGIKDLPEFPRKKVPLFSNDPEFMDSRKVQLQLNLSKWLENPTCHIDELFTFIDLSNPNRIISSGTST